MPHRAIVSLTIDDIADKLAADSRFQLVIKNEVTFQTNFRTLSIADKKLFLKAAQEKNISQVRAFFVKCGLDADNYFRIKSITISALDKEYGLDKRSDRDQILKAAVKKLDPPTFAECMALWSNGSLACQLSCEYAYDPDTCNIVCWSAMFAAYLDCLTWME